MRVIHRYSVFSCSFAALMAQAPAAAEPVPLAAANVIAEVHRSAARKDLNGIYKHMLSEFTWSFGGDADAQQALDAWRKEPGYLRQLARVTKMKCAYRKDRYVECPSFAGTSFRAGFKRANGVWKMEYFVEGD